jgi:hypothetical protein
MGCPFCASVVEYAAGDLISHILADHPKEAAAMGVAVPVASMIFKSWKTGVVASIVVAILLASFGRGRGFGLA